MSGKEVWTELQTSKLLSAYPKALWNINNFWVWQENAVNKVDVVLNAAKVEFDNKTKIEKRAESDV